MSFTDDTREAIKILTYVIVEMAAETIDMDEILIKMEQVRAIIKAPNYGEMPVYEE